MECNFPLNSSLPKVHFYPENETENFVDDPLKDPNIFRDVKKDVHEIYEDVLKIRTQGYSKIEKIRDFQKIPIDDAKAEIYEIQNKIYEDVQKICDTDASKILKKLSNRDLVTFQKIMKDVQEIYNPKTFEDLSYIGSLLQSAFTENTKWREIFFNEEVSKIFKNPSYLETLRSAYGEKIKWSVDANEKILDILIMYLDFINNFKSASTQNHIIEELERLQIKDITVEKSYIIRKTPKGDGSYQDLQITHSNLCKKIDESINQAKKFKSDEEDEQKHNMIQALEKAKTILEDTRPFFQKMAAYMSLKSKLLSIIEINSLISEIINKEDRKTKNIIEDVIQLKEKNAKRINMLKTVGLLDQVDQDQELGILKFKYLRNPCKKMWSDYDPKSPDLGSVSYGPFFL